MTPQHRRALLLPLLILAAPFAFAQFTQPDGGDLQQGTLPSTWNTGGPKCMEMPEWQVHEYNPDLYILRQSGCTDAEMPFLYLFFGRDKGLLWDTGSRNGNLVPELQLVVHRWLERNHLSTITLIVTHSHSHEDHIWGDAAVQAMRDPAIKVEFVAPTVDEASKEFSIQSWPTSMGQMDLGGRVSVLLTGDSLYPGRLYVRDFAAFKASTERLIGFLEGKPVAHVLGNHIEETRTPFKDSPIGSIYHPNEHVLELSFGDLLQLEAGLKSMEGAPHQLAFADFTIWPLDPNGHGLGPKMEETFKKTQEVELKKKWDQQN